MKSYLFKPKEKSRAIKMRFVFFALLPLMLISASSSAYAQEYTITFSLDDGTLPEGVQNPILYTVENRPTELPTPGKIGYEFGGWYTTSSMESGTEFNSIPDDLAEDITLYAKWNIISYNITYKLKDADDYDGDGNPDYPADNSANQPTYDINGYTFADPTRLAFTFIGWWNNTNSVQYTEIPSGTTGNFTVNAGWKKNWYVLMFDKVYTDAEGSIEDVQFDVSKPSITLPEVSYTHAGYEHTNKWVARDANGDPVYYNGGATLSTVDEYKELISLPSSLTPSSLCITFVPDWAPKIFKVTFKDGETTFFGPKEVAYLAEIPLPTTDPTKTGCTFDGWDNLPLNRKMTAGDLTLNAQWTPIRYTITFNTDGGSAIAPITAGYGSAVTAPAAPTKTGYTFAGWDPELPATMPLNGLTVKAKWTPITYYFVYDKGDVQGCSGTMEPTPFTIESTEVTLRENVYSAEGYYWWRWAVGSIRLENNVTLGSDDISVLIDYYSDANNKITLTSVWEYAITYELNDGSWPAGVTPYDRYNDVGLTIQTPTKTGYTFLGWTGSNGTTPEMSVKIPSGSKGPVNYTANWKINQYTITFDTDGGSAVEPITADYGSAVTAPAAPTKTGYTFAGWDPELPATMPLNGLTVKAKWDINQYAVSLPDGLEFVGTDIPADHKFDFGSTVSFKVSDGYEICATSNNPSADVAGVSISENNGTYSFTVPASDVAISADFMADVTLTVSIDGGGWTYGYDPKTPSVTKNGSPLTDLTGITFTYKDSEGEVVSSISSATPAGNYTVSAAYAGSATENPAESEPANFTIEKHRLTVYLLDHDPYTKIYGDLDPDYFYVVLNSKHDVIDPAGIVSFELNHAGGKDVGEHDIIFDPEAPIVVWDDNYICEDINTNNNKLIITPATLDVSTEDIYKTYGYDDPPIYYSVNGFQYNDENEIQITGYLSREKAGTDEGEAVGDYAITIGNLDAGKNYIFDLHPSTFTIWNGNTVVFHTAHGTAPKPEEHIPDGYGIDAPTDLDGMQNIAGYTFSGEWYEDENCTDGSLWDFSVRAISGEKETINLYAKWTPIDYTITYENIPEGVDNSLNRTSYIIGSLFALENLSDRLGATFAGWYSDAACTEASKVTGIAVDDYGDKTFYAKWDYEYYKITYELNGGTVSGNSAKIKYTIDEEFDLPRVTSAGYEFAGWCEQSDFSDDPITKITKGTYGDKKFYAKWGDPIEYNITYENIPEGVDNSLNPTSYTIGSLFALENLNARLGATFAGWYSDAACTEANKVTGISEDDYGNKTFYAKWDYEYYDITYELNGGTPSDPNYDKFQCTIDDDFDLLLVSKAGYEFAGWCEQSDLSDDTKTKITKGTNGNKKFYAKWGDPIEYNITFDTDGGSDIDPIAYTIESETIDLSAIKAEKPYYDFVKWVDNNGTEVKQISKGSYGDIALKANYAPSQYSITFDVDGGSNIDPIAYTIESETIDLSAIKTEKVGYHFVKWLDDKDAEVTQIVKGSNGNVALTALFEAHSFTKYIYNNDATTETDGTETAVCDHEGCNAIDVRIAEGTKLPCSISDEPTESVVIYAHHNTIVVENAVEDIFIYDIDGRCVANRDAASHVSITMQREGIYIVKCGNTVKRVLVM